LQPGRYERPCSQLSASNMSAGRTRRLVVTADDFGLSVPVNEAIDGAHRSGILTAASLMVGGSACADAVERARKLPALGVGLHVVLVNGRPVLPPESVPDLVDARGDSLSGGERRRVEIARSLATEPAFLLLDEPFTGIDPIAVADIQAMIRQLRDRGLGILITDHQVRETLAIVDRAYILNNDRIEVSGSAQEVLDSPVARKFYLGEGFRL